ncbi:MAG TPA: DUF2721 domain-containing protein [Capsulimonadaceae bacterium]|jgi:hypothetical protein
MATIPDMSSNAFTMLTFIAAPAVLTNAASVLALGTSNRFARAVDRARTLAQQLTQKAMEHEPDAYAILVRQFDRVQARTILLVRALKCFYSALGSFAAAALVSLIGAGLALSTHHWLYTGAVTVALAAGVYGVSAMVWGSSLLVRDTQLAVVNLSEEGELVRAQMRQMREELERVGESGDSEDDEAV